METKEIKQQIRKLKKPKLKCRAGTAERISLHRQIKELSNKLAEQQKIYPEKEKLITEILKYEPDISDFIDLRKFETSQLELHLKKLKERKNNV